MTITGQLTLANRDSMVQMPAYICQLHIQPKHPKTSTKNESHAKPQEQTSFACSGALSESSLAELITP